MVSEDGQTIVRDREELYRRLGKLEKHLDVALWDRAREETAQPGLQETIDLLPYAALLRFNGRVDHANAPAVAAFAAASQGDLHGLPWRDLLHPDDRPSPGIRKPAPESENGLGTTRFLRLDGVVLRAATREIQIPWRSRTASLVLIGEWGFLPGGENDRRILHGPVAVRALDAVGEGVWEWDPETGRLEISPRIRSLLGLSTRPADNEQPHSWQGLIHPEDRARNERRLREHLSGREPVYQCTLRWRKADGEYLWLDIRGQAERNASGSIQRLIGLARDDTERQSQERERSRAEARAVDTQAQIADAMDLAGDGFGLFDATDRLVLQNSRFGAMFPEISKQIVRGAFYSDIMAAAVETGGITLPEDEKKAWLAQRLAHHQNPAGKFIVQARDGRHIRVTECHLSSGGTVVICADITPLKRAEQDLETRISELEATKGLLETQRAQLQEFAEQLAHARDYADFANRTKSEFLANMSHELRTPLNAIMGFSEVIKNELFGPVGLTQYVDYAGDIYNSGAHLLEIINDILDLSKVEAGKLDISPERIDVREVADAVVRIVRARAEASGIKLVHEISPDLPYLYADKRKLKQLLLNLLSNAIKFTPGSGTVDLIGSVREDGGISISVRDTGIGIDPAQFDHVLSPFGQIDSALAREHQGTGLGLPLVKALIEIHGGRIELDSELGRGTEVRLNFPVERSRPS